MKQLDANDLVIFAQVALAGSVSRAAETLGLPKSTVSRRLSLLEERLGERALLRTTRRIVLTEFGEHLLEHARQVVAEVDAVTALSEHRQAGPTGKLRVSMPSDFANLLLGDMLAAFVAMHPAVSLELDLSPRRVDLLGEQFDIAVRVGSLPDDSLLAARKLADLPNSLYAAPDYLAEHGAPASPECLVRHEAVRLLASDGSALGWTLVNGSKRWEGVPPGRVTANSPEVLIRLAIAGAGIAAVPDFFAVSGVKQGRLQRVMPDWHLPARQAWAVFPGRRLMPAKARAFITMLQSALESATQEPS